MSLIFLLLWLGGVDWSLGLKYGGTEVRESSVLSQRMDTFERLLLEQDAELLRQDSLLRHQQSLLRQQAAKLSRQETKLSRQETKLSRQETKLSRQETKLSRQETKLSRQETLLFQFGNIIQQLRAEKLDIALDLHNGPASDQLQAVPEMLTTHCHNATGDAEPAHATTESDDTVTSESHDVMSRSDDGGPLEAVVSQISQRVTEMSADIQAMKTQTNTDIQTLKTQTNTDIQALKNSDTQQDHDIQDARSSTFVHWGSSRCSASSQLVYSGVVGGSWFGDSGAATNYLCLTLSPVFGDHKEAYAHLFGGEYETHDSHQNKDPVCAVCRSAFSTTVMIPGTNVCTPGWHLQYSGFLMAGAYDHAAGSEYICVDSHLENRSSSDQDENGKLLHYTVTRCGSLPCTPYVNDKTVTCAVCSK